MQWQIIGTPGFATLNFALLSEELVFSQPRAMVLMSTGVEISSAIGGSIGRGGVISGLKGVLAGESFASAVFRAKRDGEKLVLGPDTIGPIVAISLCPERTLLIAKGSYLAHLVPVHLEAQYGGVKSLIAKKGLYLLRATGPGQIFLTGAGEICEINLCEGERIAIDNDFVVAFESTVRFEVVTAAKGLKDSFLSGEGLVNRYTGPGTVYYQTRGKNRPGMVSTLLNTVSWP